MMIINSQFIFATLIILIGIIFLWCRAKFKALSTYQIWEKIRFNSLWLYL